MNTEVLLESSSSEFSQEIREIGKAILKELDSVCKKISEYAVLEFIGEEDVANFEDIIQELSRCIDKHLPKVRSIFEKYSTGDSINIGTDLLHIWFGFSNSLSGLQYGYKEQIHQIVNEDTYEISIVHGFPNKWKTLLDSISGYMDRTRKL